jgi:hypothetical protein
MDGIWTYTVPLRASGGVLVIRNGKVAGGDGTYVCTGTCLLDNDTVRLNLTYEIYNAAGSLGSVWGDTADRIEVVFDGISDGDMVFGKARRLGFDLEVAVTLLRYTKQTEGY